MTVHLNILTWNERTFGGAYHRRHGQILREEIRNNCLIKRNLDIIMIQEHHLNSRRMAKYGYLLSQQYFMFWARGSGLAKALGGICMTIHKKWTDQVVEQKILQEGRAQYLIIDWEGEKMCVLNIYTPNQSSERETFWTLVFSFQNLPLVCLRRNFL